MTIRKYASPEAFKQALEQRLRTSAKTGAGFARKKDLPDLALLATTRTIEARRLRAAIEQTFAFRKTHPLPAKLPDPPAAWENPYSTMAREDGLAWGTLDEVAKAAKSFLDPVLAGELDAEWNPGTWTWDAR